MSDWAFFPFVFLIPVVAIIGGIAAAITSTIVRGRVRELEIRERIAMIERGLVPPPEKDPQGFERAMNHYERARGVEAEWRGRKSTRYRSAGVTLMGIGFGLMIMMSFAGGAINEGIGVGGFVVILGLAFFLNSFFGERYEPPAAPATGSREQAPPAA
jgi:phosphate/sulfate permease